MSDIGSSSMSDNGSSSDASGYEDIAEYFDEKTFKAMSSLEKFSLRRQKERYEQSLAGDVHIPMPAFIEAYCSKLHQRIKESRNRTDKISNKENIKRKSDTTKTSSDKRRKKSEPGDTGVLRTSRRLLNKESSDHLTSLRKDAMDQSDDEFAGIKPYFTPSEWTKMPLLSKRHALSAKESYENNIKKGVSATLPKFMTSQGRLASSAAASAESPAASFAHSSSLNKPSSSKNQHDDDDYNLFSSPGKHTRETCADLEVDGQETSTILTESVLEQAIAKVIRLAAPNLLDSTCSSIAKHLVCIHGVESVEDLSIVEESWLSTAFELKSIALKKIMLEFAKPIRKGETSSKQIPKKPKESSLMREQSADVHIISRPSLAKKITEVGKFDLKIVWGNMSNSLLMSLEKGEVPSATDRASMVRVLAKDIIENYEKLKRTDPTIRQKTPGRNVYIATVEAIFKDFEACFQDRLKGKIVGSGMFSLTDQLETCVENQYRSHTAKGKSSLPSKGNRAAACILATKYSPAMSKEEKLSAEEDRRQLLAIYRKPQIEWDWDEIKTRMEASLPAQRFMITAKKRSIIDLNEKWPFLFEFQGALCHLHEITGADVLGNFKDFIQGSLDDLINYLTIESPKRIKNIKISNAASQGRGEHRRLLGAISMLANHFDEDVKTILLSAEATLLPHEVASELEDLPATPCIVALEDSPFTATQYFLVIEKYCVNATLTNGLEAVAALCARFFNFGFLYPPKASVTLSYIERAMANLTDADGLQKAQTNGGGILRGSYNKVKTLVDGIEKFVKDMEGDE